MGRQGEAEEEMLVAGIDLGSGSTKCVLIDEGQHVLGTADARTKADFVKVAEDVLAEALARSGRRRDEISYVATTGLGRYAVPFRDIQITDLTCGARGAYFLFPSTKYVLDIGAQSTRAIRLRDGGRVKEFHMNEKCAAGSGGFLERAARYLDVAVDHIGDLSMESQSAQPISSVCAVLAESEIINHVSEGRTVPDILRGIHDSLADRSFGQLKRVGLDGELTFIGGVARQAGMVASGRAVWKVQVNVPAHPESVAALGAALLGLRRLQKRQVLAAAS